MAETKNILLLGNGFVAGPCLTHLLKRPEYHVTVASRHLASSQVRTTKQSLIKS